MTIKEKTLRLSTSWGLTAHLANVDSPFQRELDLLLPSMDAFETVTFKLKILADLAFTSYKEATFVEHKVPVYSITITRIANNYLMFLIDQLSLQCPWLSKSPPVLDLPLNVYAPFTVQYKLHTSYSKKFVNIHVQGKKFPSI